jgi:hypothetical protein
MFERYTTIDPRSSQKTRTQHTSSKVALLFVYYGCITNNENHATSWVAFNATPAGKSEDHFGLDCRRPIIIMGPHTCSLVQYE